ncbi:MAG TPA: hypothetical protein VHK67_07490 [Rhabdochlamydiaceae bacterium]|jgi:hypothetical protein|nr:hypothetical protein [Rhabdochlamydiaceae bacterium]
MIEICMLFGMNIYGCAAIGGVVGGIFGGIDGVRHLVTVIFLDVMRTNIFFAGCPSKPYTVDPDLVPQGVLLRTVVIGAVIGTLVGTVCAVAYNRLFPKNRESN